MCSVLLTYFSNGMIFCVCYIQTVCVPDQSLRRMELGLICHSTFQSWFAITIHCTHLPWEGEGEMRREGESGEVRGGDEAGGERGRPKVTTLCHLTCLDLHR